MHKESSIAHKREEIGKIQLYVLNISVKYHLYPKVIEATITLKPRNERCLSSRPVTYATISFRPRCFITVLVHP